MGDLYHTQTYVYKGLKVDFITRPRFLFRYKTGTGKKHVKANELIR